MKLLLDENLPHAIRAELSGHDVFTVQYLGWSDRPLLPRLRKAIKAATPGKVRRIG